MTKEKLQEALEGLRSGFQADGADLEIRNMDDGTVEVELVFGPDVCEECILPGEMITKIVEKRLKEQVPDLKAVKLIDPRHAV
jgi:Fe-S cluster biogenesis protein NfuA